MSEVVLINEIAAAARFGMSRSWFQRMRWAGGGPPYFKINSAVRYPVEELEKYFFAKKQCSTSDKDIMSAKNSGVLTNAN